MRALILAGDGINSENELAKAFEKVGFETDIMVLSEIVETGLETYDVFAIPGGFSFGDDLGSGKVLSLKLEHYLKDKLEDFIKKGKLILGICNGFQVLVQMGLLPTNDKAALLANKQKEFINKWVRVKTNSKNQSPWLSSFHDKEFYIPIRHGEGRFYSTNSKNINVALEYQEEVNGSLDNIAGITDKTGLIFGLMPHPEAAFEDFQIPFQDKTSYSLQFFKNAYEYTRSQK